MVAMDRTINDRELKLISLGGILFFLLMVFRNAWVSDDAMITFRTIENFRAGLGLGYNPYIRVQGFTHPLWMFVLSFLYFIQVNLFGLSAPNGLVFLSIGISMVFSGLTIWLLMTRLVNPNLLSLGFFATTLVLSRAYVDFSTSGLENPLTHLLIAVFIWQFFQDKIRIGILSFLASLISLNRLDILIMVLPALGYAFWRERGFWGYNFRSSFLAFLPLIFWEAFSLFYYGFPFPNTAYAKLNTGIADFRLLLQGFDYFINSIHWDPLTLFVIGLSGLVIWIEREPKSMAMFTGVLLYLFYILKIGGDFMSGRFFTAVLLVAVSLLARWKPTSVQVLKAGWVAILLLGTFSFKSTLLDPLFPEPIGNEINKVPLIDSHGIADERLYYFMKDQGFVQQGLRVQNGYQEVEVIGSPLAGEEWSFVQIKDVHIVGALGKKGYQVGPEIYIIDYFALSDPLLARLPIEDAIDWRIGHFKRAIPIGYRETLKSGTNHIADPDLAEYYEKLHYVVAGRLWDWERLREIWNLNTGQYDYLLINYLSQRK